jgi:predicted dehydrogenase
MSRKVSRRHFLQAGSVSAVAAGFWLTGGVTESFAAQRGGGANERLNIACIGCGGQGASDHNGVRGENIVALCDVDSVHARRVFETYPKVTKYTDFREMLDKQRDIQAVVVATPDHTHFHASATAIRMGKHVYCEKPLTHSVWEARQLRELAAKHKVATQMGNQGTSNNGLRYGVELIRSGAIGDVSEVHVWTNRPIWPQNVNRPKARQEPPKTLNWDLWLGPAPERPYNGEIQANKRPTYAPFNWRGWWDFGTGALGDMGCHTMNLPYMALRLGAPSTVSADVQGQVNPETGPEGCTITYEFPARPAAKDPPPQSAAMPACRLFWYERRRPPMNLLQGIQPGGSGCLIIGTRGRLYTASDYGDGIRLLPPGDVREYRIPSPSLPRSPGHHAEWIRACKGGVPAMSNFDYAGPLTEMVLLGNVAIRVGRRITWDSAKLQAIDLPAAAQYIRPGYRKGWEWNA